MNIETDDWIRLADIEIHSKLLRSRTAYRAAQSMGLIHEFFGVQCIRKSDVGVLESHRRPAGNPQWIGDYEAAAAAADKANERKRRRLASSGPTEAEVRRNKRLAKVGAASIGKARAAKR